MFNYSSFPITSLAFLLSGIFLGVFCFNRFTEYRKLTTNLVTKQFWLASFYVSLGFFIFGLPGLFTSQPMILSVFAGIALIVNSIGFSFFALIPLNNWLSARSYVLTKYGLFLFVSLLAACLIIRPPMTTLVSGIVHWNFGYLIGILAAIQMDVAFMLNILLLGIHFYRFQQLSAINAMLLIITFTLTGLGGTYQYVGDSALLLSLSAAGLYVGVTAIFFSVVRVNISKLLS